MSISFDISELVKRRREDLHQPGRGRVIQQGV
jgi:hypothetical protein